MRRMECQSSCHVSEVLNELKTIENRMSAETGKRTGETSQRYMTCSGRSPRFAA
jgi:hypothetical protein